MRATFAAGCFWGVQKTFDDVLGVMSTTVGYCGGHTENPTYEEVCQGDTGHAESIDIIYDPNLVSYQQLLDIFWHMHHPHGKPDTTSQYRSAIFYHDDEQKELAQGSKHDFSVQIAPAGQFYAAEDYHQKYYLTHKVDAC